MLTGKYEMRKNNFILAVQYKLFKNIQTLCFLISKAPAYISSVLTPDGHTSLMNLFTFSSILIPWSTSSFLYLQQGKGGALPPKKGTICIAFQWLPFFEISWYLKPASNETGCKYRDRIQTPVMHALQIFVHIHITSWQRRINSHLQANYRLRSFLTQ